MLCVLCRFVALPILVLIGLFCASDRVRAQSYPIDCAILLCLAGGWPASLPCAQARAEFIRRITPWPVEPPLQIWRCPMRASFTGGGDQASRIIDIVLRDHGEPSHEPEPTTPDRRIADPAAHLGDRASALEGTGGYELHRVRDRANVDISGPEFDFVQSIRVFDVRHAQQQELPRDGGCSRTAIVVLGRYGTQGEFSWQRSSTTALPDAHVGLERWGETCPGIFYRSVFVDWRDYEGNYGFEQVNY